MPYTADSEIDLSERINKNYLISSQHRRRGNPNKCRWTITLEEEVECFIQSIDSNWIDGAFAWGLHFVNDTIDVLGLNNDDEDLKLAKFINSDGTIIYHGYPADYINRSQDRPTNNILKMWVNSGHITKAKMTKINRGYSCNL